MPEKVNIPNAIKVGDFFESCSFHPCLCISVDETGRHIEGISLVNGIVHNCNVVHCGIRKLSLREAVEWKLSGPKFIENMEVDQPWW